MSGSTDIPADFFAPVALDIERRPDGTIILQPQQELGSYARCLGEHLKRWADEAPERTFLAQRYADGPQQGEWQHLSYAEALQRVTALAAGLLQRDLGPDRPIAILSGNSISQGLLMLAAMHVGIPVAPISPAYALMSKDFAKLKYVLALAGPGMIYVENPAPFAAALAALDTDGVDLICASGADGHPGFEAIEALSRDDAEALAAVERAFAAVTPDTVAKILFTSGSTGNPKGVMNTQRMLCSNQKAMALSWPFLEKKPPVLVDWLPWNHTFGANHNFNMILRNGGSLYIDEGKPMPAAIGVSIENLKSVSPTMYFNVPGGFEALLPHLEADEELATSLFRNLDLVFYAAAALPQVLWERIEAVALKTTGKTPIFSSGWGSTETAPLATGVHFPISRAGTIGLPVPGVAIKMVPCGDTHELRVKGANITPGYWREPALSEAAFDEEGFYKIGDAGKFEDPANPDAGIAFDGRLGENFKLRSGTWVNVGNLRLAVISAAKPVIRDAVVAGDGETKVSLLAFPDEPGCRGLIGEAADGMSLEEVIAHPQVLARLKTQLAAYNADNPASSTRIHRVMLVTAPPDVDAGESTDKGYINQRGVLKNRADLVARLYADDVSGDAEVIEI